jgi:hypothetical protein
VSRNQKSQSHLSSAGLYCRRICREPKPRLISLICGSICVGSNRAGSHRRCMTGRRGVTMVFDAALESNETVFRPAPVSVRPKTLQSENAVKRVFERVE